MISVSAPDYSWAKTKTDKKLSSISKFQVHRCVYLLLLLLITLNALFKIVLSLNSWTPLMKTHQRSALEPTTVTCLMQLD